MTRKKPKGWVRLLVGLLLFMLCLLGLFAGFVVSVAMAYSRHLPDVEKLRTYQPSETTKIFTANGELIATLFKENRTWVSIKEMPKDLQNAIVASEDARFYQHPGIDLVGIGRAAWWDYRSKGTAQGASTITMQLARSVFLRPEQTLSRKVQEALISIKLERKFTKSQLLEFYLNQIYFGSGAYGVEAAAEVYFNKKVSQLTLSECAMIVGTAPAPTSYSPFVDREAARERQMLVLRRMVTCGYITRAQAEDALREPLRLAPPRKDLFVLKMPYFTTYVLQELVKKYGEDQLYRGGLRVYTSVDPRMQDAAQEAVNWGVNELGRSHNVHQGALVAIEPRTGLIRAMVGGVGWSEKSQFNRAWQTQQPAGSSFKIFVYTSALENGFCPDTYVSDTPATFSIGPGDSWSPKNSDGRYMGSIPLRTALQYSRNVVSARLTQRLTPVKVIDTAYKMGIHSHLDNNLSIALGAVAICPLEMAAGISTLANSGKAIEPQCVKLVRDSEGHVLEDNNRPLEQAVMTSSVAFAMTEMLQNAVQAGTGYNARLDDRPAAGKTGTTDSHRDAWFCGFTPQLAAAVWTGNDDNTPMWGTFGGDVPAPIWKRFMTAALRGRPVEHFGADANGEVEVAMCKESGKRASALCPDRELQKFKWNVVPQSFCTLHVIEAQSVTSAPPATAAPEPSPSAEPEDEAPAATPEEPPAMKDYEPTPEPASSPTATSAPPQPTTTPVPAASPAPETEAPSPTPDL